MHNQQIVSNFSFPNLKSRIAVINMSRNRCRMEEQIHLQSQRFTFFNCSVLYFSIKLTLQFCITCTIKSYFWNAMMDNYQSESQSIVWVLNSIQIQHYYQLKRIVEPYELCIDNQWFVYRITWFQFVNDVDWTRFEQS